MNFGKFLGTPFFTEHLRRLLLKPCPTNLKMWIFCSKFLKNTCGNVHLRESSNHLIRIQVDNWNTGKMWQVINKRHQNNFNKTYSKLTIFLTINVFIVNFEQILQIVLVFPLLNLNCRLGNTYSKSSYGIIAFIPSSK